MGYPHPHPVEQGGHLLYASARCRDNAHGAPLDDVAESHDHAVYYRGPAVRPHHHEPLLPPPGLEVQLLFQGDIAAEYEKVEAPIKGLRCLPIGVLPGDRYGGHVGPREPFQGRLEALGEVLLLYPPPLSGELVLNPLDHLFDPPLLHIQ